MNRTHFVRALVVVAAAAGSSLALAQPTKTVQLVIGFPAGGAVDNVARAFAEQLRQDSGAAVIVENRQGASGKIGIDALLSAPTDGQTLAMIPC